MQSQNSIVPETDTQDTLHPLRPLSFTEIMDGMFSLYRNNFQLFFKITAVYFVISYVLDVLKNWVNDTLVSESLVSILSFNLIISIGLFLLTIFITGALYYTTAHVYLSKNITATESIQQSLRCFFTLIGASIIYILVSGGLSITIIGIPFGLYFFIRWSLHAQPILLEKSSAMISLRRSSELVKGSWWRVFGIILAIILINFMIVLILTISLTIIFLLIQGTSELLPRVNFYKNILFLFEPTPNQLGWGMYLFWSLITRGIHSLAMPILSIGSTLLYFDMRIRKEAYDLEMQATTPVDQMQNP